MEQKSQHNSILPSKSYIGHFLKQGSRQQGSHYAICFKDDLYILSGNISYLGIVALSDRGSHEVWEGHLKF